MQYITETPNPNESKRQANPVRVQSPDRVVPTHVFAKNVKICFIRHYSPFPAIVGKKRK